CPTRCCRRAGAASFSSSSSSCSTLCATGRAQKQLSRLFKQGPSRCQGPPSVLLQQARAHPATASPAVHADMTPPLQDPTTGPAPSSMVTGGAGCQVNHPPYPAVAVQQWSPTQQQATTALGPRPKWSSGWYPRQGSSLHPRWDVLPVHCKL
ncbi:uncharacterized protein B0I36DRAFT_413219, partial [Microdochium trichocladiopsis]